MWWIDELPYPGPYEDWSAENIVVHMDPAVNLVDKVYRYMRNGDSVSIESNAFRISVT